MDSHAQLLYWFCCQCADTKSLMKILVEAKESLYLAKFNQEKARQNNNFEKFEFYSKEVGRFTFQVLAVSKTIDERLLGGSR